MRISITSARRWLVVPLLSVVSLAAAGADVRLVEAVRTDDNARVRVLLKEKVDVNAPLNDGATALAWAAHRNNLEAAELLILAGADLNAANLYGVTPLSLACSNGNAAIVEKLLVSGANPNLALQSGETPLMTAARTGNAGAVKSLLLHGAEVEARESQRSQTALMWALAENHRDAATLLIATGADLHARSKGGFTPLLFAAQEGDVDTVRLLLAAGANVNDATPNEGNALAVATANGHEPLALFLLDHGADARAADQYGMTALHYTMLKGLSTAASVGYTPDNFYLFDRPRMPQLVKALLAHGADPNARIVKMPRVPGGRAQNSIWALAGATPFLLAAAATDADAMRVLAAAGADPNIPAGKNMTPLMAAAGLMRAMNFAPVPRSDEDTRASLEAVKVAIDLGNDVNARTAIGDTAMFGAAYLGGTDSVEYMAAHGAQVDVENMHGQTPLSIAEMRWGPELPRLHDDTLRPRHIFESTAEALIKWGAQPLSATTRTLFKPAGGSASAEASGDK